MANNTTHTGPFDIGGLPAELRALIASFVASKEEDIVITTRNDPKGTFRGKRGFSFVSPSPQYHAFVSSRVTRATYLEALGNHIVENVDDVSVNVEDLKFTNLRAFIQAVFRAGKLQQFLMQPVAANLMQPAAANPVPLRRLVLFHITSNNFPDTFDNAFRFFNFLTNLMKKAPGPAADDVNMFHLVRECGNQDRLVKALNTLGASGTMGQIPEMLFVAFRHYHFISERDATDQMAPEIQAAEEEEENIMNGLAGEETSEQAVGGAEVSGENDDTEDANLSGGINGEYTGVVGGGTQYGWVEEMDEGVDREMNEEMNEQMDVESDLDQIKEEEVEEETVGVLYDHDQHQMVANYQPPADFSSFLGQVASGSGAYAPTYQSFWGSY